MMCSKNILSGYLLILAIVIGILFFFPAYAPFASKTSANHLEDLMQAGTEAYHRLDYSSALDSWSEGHKLAERAGNYRYKAKFAGKIGNVYNRLHQYQKALSFYKQALLIMRKIGDRSGEGKALTAIGIVYRKVGLIEEALSYHQQALAIKRDSGDRAGEWKHLVSIGMAHGDLGQYENALSHFKQALLIVRQIDYRSGEGKVLTNIGIAYGMLGQYDKALRCHKQAIAIKRENSDRAGEWNDLAGIGFVYDSLGEYDRALSNYEQALAIAREFSNRSGEGTVLNGIGNVYRKQRQYGRALSYYKQALAIHRETKNRAGESSDLGNIGIVYGTLGDYKKALSNFEQALSILREFRNRSDEGMVLTNIGLLYLKAGHLDKALTFSEQALRVANEVGSPEIIWRVHLVLQRIYKGMDNPLAAIFFGKQSVDTLQSMRTHMGGLERSLLQSFIDEKQFVYEELADLLVDQGRLPEAQQVLAMLKEEEFFDFIHRSSEKDPRDTKVSYTSKEKHWKIRYSQIRDNLVSIAHEYKKLQSKLILEGTKEDQARLIKLERDLDVALKAFGTYLVELKKDFKERKREQQREFAELSNKQKLVGLTAAEETRLAELERDLDKGFPEKELKSLRAFQSTLRQLGKGTVAIHYLSTTDRLRIIVTGGNASLPPFHRDSSIGEKELNRLIFQYRDTLQHRWRNPTPQAQQLYKSILKPIEDDLMKMGARTLLVYLDGALRYLPLAALHDGKSYVAERFGFLMYIASAKDKLKDRPVRPWKVAGLGVSEATAGFSALEAVPGELNGIIKESVEDPVGVLPGTIHLNKEFSQQNLSGVLRQGYPVIHVASHFRFVPGTEVDSFLLLGGGERLNLEQFVSVKYPMDKVDLLTLSACETAVGGGVKEDGSEVEGFGALAQRQGAKAVLATLWKVKDSSTGQFMQLFYKLREEMKLTKAEALRRVQQMFIHGEEQMPTTQKKGNSRAAWPVDETEGGYKFNPEAPYAHPYYWAPFILMGNFL
jgi:CHAT domain-containing protein/tetratricopeptide (TPR) repeat protein